MRFAGRTNPRIGDAGGPASSSSRARRSPALRAGDTLHDDLAATHEEPDDDGRAIRGLICFFDERVDLELAEPQERPVTQWSHRRL